MVASHHGKARDVSPARLRSPPEAFTGNFPPGAAGDYVASEYPGTLEAACAAGSLQRRGSEKLTPGAPSFLSGSSAGLTYVTPTVRFH